MKIKKLEDVVKKFEMTHVNLMCPFVPLVVGFLSKFKFGFENENKI